MSVRGALLALLLRAAVSAGPPPALYTTFPQGTPSETWPDGPFLGNGVTGVVIGGAPGTVTLYFALSGFWSTGYGPNSSMPPLLDPRSNFPGCPAPECMITVGLTLATVELSSSVLASKSATWTATFDLASASATVEITDGTPSHGLRLTTFVSATTQLTIVEVVNTGTSPLPFNVTTAGNGNTQDVPIKGGCVDSGGGNAVPCPPSGGSILNHWLTKDANPPGAGALPITAALASRTLSCTGCVVGATVPYTAAVNHTSWLGGEPVSTRTRGTSTAGVLAPRGGFTAALSAASSHDPGVAPAAPLDVAMRAVAATDVGAMPALRASHRAWWDTFFSKSGVTLDPAAKDVEAYWWTSIYALGAGSRAGGVTMDLWSPWRTTDYSRWRSNPTMDYNQQALYSGAVAANHIEVLQPYYDFIRDVVATGGPAKEAAALGCPGVHLSVDYGPFGLKMGVYGEVQGWNIRSNAAYAAVQYAYHWAAVSHDDPSTLQWVESYAWPYLTQVAAFWECYLNKTEVPGAPDGYLYYALVDCDGDENCSPQGNAVWTIVYVARLLDTLMSVASATGRAPGARWAEIRAHLPPIPTWDYNGTIVLADYGLCTATGGPCNTKGWEKQSGYLHSLWPGELLSMSDANATLLVAANATFTLTAWSQFNSFSWVYASAARVGWPPADTLRRFQAELASGAGGGTSRTNRLVAFNGLCSDSLGAVAYVHDALVQGQEGFLRLFPAWPANLSAAFSSLRMRGALLVSAVYGGRAEWAGRVAGLTGGTLNMTVACEAVGKVSVLNPWPGGAVTVADAATGTAQALTWGTVGGVNGGATFSWSGEAGRSYHATCRGAGCATAEAAHASSAAHGQ